MIVQTINNEYHFWDWLQNSDSYKNNFSVQGAKALQAYIDETSEGYAAEFDPIAWCVEFTEYNNLKEFNTDYNSANPFDNWDEVAENTTVIELGDGGAIVGEF